MALIPRSMKDKGWGNLKIGQTDLRLKTHGCYVIALSILVGKYPNVVLKKLNQNFCFDKDGKLLNEKAAKVLGFEEYRWLPPDTKLTEPITAETDHYVDKGIPQHFFIALPNGNIIDPLDGGIKPNPYKIISYRLFKKKDVFPARPPEPDIAPTAPATERLKELEREKILRGTKPPTIWEMIYAWICRVFRKGA